MGVLHGPASRRAAERADVALVVRCPGRCDRPGPADRRAGHGPWLRHAARAQQVGPGGRRFRPRPRARVNSKLRLRPRVSPPAPVRGATSTACWPSPRAGRPPPRPDSSTGAQPLSPTSWPPAAAAAGRRLKLHGPDRHGPTAPTIQVNSRKLIVRDWAYFLENRLRERYRLEGVPLVIDPCGSVGKRGGGGTLERRGARRA